MRRAYEYLSEVIPDRYKPNDVDSVMCKIQNFNDSQFTTHSDVMNMFDYAIKKAKEQHL